MVANWLEQCLYIAKSTDSIPLFLLSGNCVWTLSKSFAHNCSAIDASSIDNGAKIMAIKMHNNNNYGSVGNSLRYSIRQVISFLA